jgi:DNA-binding response OmpR family regulator
MTPGKLIVVIIEDDLPTLELYRRELSAEYEVLGTLGEQEALQMVRRPGVRAVVLEPGWEDGRGWDLLTMIRQILRNAPVPIVLCSSLDERRRGLEAGAAAYLVKPVLPTELRDVIHQVLAAQHLSRLNKLTHF